MEEAERQHIRNCIRTSSPSASFERCPWSQMGPPEEICLSWWTSWRTSGALPYEGAASEQPAYVLEAIELCESEALTTQAERMPKPKKPGVPHERDR